MGIQSFPTGYKFRCKDIKNDIFPVQNRNSIIITLKWADFPPPQEGSLSVALQFHSYYGLEDVAGE
jgi:hypothetical protein